MARADLLLELARAGSHGDQSLFRKALEALIAEERAKQHHILADRLAAHLHSPSNGTQPVQPGPLRKNGAPLELFYELVPERSTADLVLAENIRSACDELVEEQHRADLLRAYNLEPRHRVLLVGPPGNGKSSLAEALAWELSVPFLVVRYEAVIASYLGETAVRLSQLFDQARTRRCLLFFDEFDVVGKERGDVHETGEIKRVVSSLLVQIDALPSYVVVVTATNHPELLDKAVWRRFQLRLELAQPNHAQAEEWFRRFERRAGSKLGISPTVLARRMKGANFSELEQFGLDVQRRLVLAHPDADIRKISEERLKQWAERVTPMAPAQPVP